MKNKLLIIGASGHGKVVADIALKMNKWEEIAFLDDDESKITSMGLRVIGTSTDVDKYIDEYDVFVGIGNNSTRELIQDSLEKKGASVPILIHPNTVCGEQVHIGSGSVVMPGVVINCCSEIGKGSIINTGVTLDHDNIIEDFTHISPGVHLAGSVSIGKKTWIGIGSVVSNNVNIVEECTVGAGSLVIRDIKKSGTYIGAPVKRMDENDKFKGEGD
ncbi:acetyltransferase [Salimicrobium humidisoli]|uniref:Acetyltransferase n=1 Tax=Salimicrobium humidisoli TaxID=2029857 RepID=A0ABX4HT92_9BACI|nr:acetyltransferase [Salimicrobium humidisoli]PBB06451.1 acetyltransferase [Salimicrobium humidisoli]